MESLTRSWISSCWCVSVGIVITASQPPMIKLMKLCIQETTCLFHKGVSIKLIVNIMKKTFSEIKKFNSAMRSWSTLTHGRFTTSRKDHIILIIDVESREDSNFSVFDNTGAVLASTTTETDKNNSDKKINYINLYDSEKVTDGPFKVLSNNLGFQMWSTWVQTFEILKRRKLPDGY